LLVTTCHLNVGDVSTWTRCYNGTVPGPTLRVRPGQRLAITLINDLSHHGNIHHQMLNVSGYGDALNVSWLHDHSNASSWQDARGTGTLFGSPNTTNLHLHGLVVPASSPADDVMMAIKPKSSFDYVYNVPAHHMSGTLWYHPHHHHSTAGQANGGMFGALIVEDPPESLPPAVLEAEERLVVMNTLCVQMQTAVARMSGDNLWKTNSTAKVTLVNGTLEPTSAIQSGVWYRFRFVYASMFSSVRLALKSETATCQMQLLAKDGITLREAPRLVKRIWLAAGNRADVMVSCTCQGQSSCNASFRSEWGPRTDAEFDDADRHWNGIGVTRTWVGDVFHLHISGRSTARALPIFNPRMPCYLADLTSLDSSQIAPGNKVGVGMFWEQKQGNGFTGEDSKELSNHYHSIMKGQFGMIFNNTHNRMMNDDQRAAGTLPFDEVQEWTVRGTQWHPFHTHGQPYQIAALPTKEDLVESLILHNDAENETLGPHMNATIWSLIEDDDGWFQVGDWADTFQDLGTQVVIRVAPRIPDLATMVFHCHYLNHEDQGMMTFVDVEQGSSSCSKGAQCAKALVPQCYTEASQAGFILKSPSTSLRR